MAHLLSISPKLYQEMELYSVHPQAGAFTSWTHFFPHKALLASNADSLWSLSTLTRFSQRKYPENPVPTFSPNVARKRKADVTLRQQTHRS